MSQKLEITVQQVNEAAIRRAKQYALHAGSTFFGIPRGGVPAAYALAWACGGGVVGNPDNAFCLVDDLRDSGETAQRWGELYRKEVIVLFDKNEEPWKNKWLVLPWERAPEDQSADDIGLRLLQYVGEDSTREGLRETPKRVADYWREATSGYGVATEEILKVFEDGADGVDEMVFQGSIPFFSTCEHHLVPFFGVVHIGYIPSGKIIGLSKLARLVEVYARRLQVQERMTNCIADELEMHLETKGVGVVVRARHLCMESRGIKKIGTVTYTSALRGVMKTAEGARGEFLEFVKLSDARNPNI